jgi:hypothetical protein
MRHTIQSTTSFSRSKRATSDIWPVVNWTYSAVHSIKAHDKNLFPVNKGQCICCRITWRIKRHGYPQFCQYISQKTQFLYAKVRRLWTFSRSRRIERWSSISCICILKSVKCETGSEMIFGLCMLKRQDKW